jgi:maltose alpha-D-glucosyltransferase/alpha-amylase
MTHDSTWYKNAIFYEIYIRAFFDSDGDGQGDLQGLAQKLDYLQELGVDAIWLLPFYPSPLKDDGYDIADFTNVLPQYGTLEDFRILLQEAHKRGVRVIIDLVLNHTSDQHPWFQAARADRNSPYRDYYVWSDTDKKYADARIIFLDTEKSNWAWDEVAGQYYWHRFYASQPDLNYNNPKVRKEIFRIVKFWLDLGIDGFRADAVPYLFEREGTNCENLPETHAFLKQLRRFIDEHYPGKILLSEANQWPQDVRPYFGEGDEFHMAFHFPVMPRIYMALGKEDVSPLVWILQRTPPIPSDCQWCTFLRNHDELTLEMVTQEEREWMWQKFAPLPRMRLNLGIRRRLAPLLGNNQYLIELANSLLFTLPGSPVIYYGDEIGMGDNIWLPDRNGVRTPMQWDDGLNAGFSKANPDKLYSPVISEEPYNPQIVNVKLLREQPKSLWHRTQRMISLRKAHPALGYGDFHWVDASTQSVAAYQRTLKREQYLIINNLKNKQQVVNISLSDQYNSHTTNILNETNGPEIINGQLSLKLGAYRYVWLKLNKLI